jgi:glucoamylase
MEQLAGDGGMVPEQVWDADDIPQRGLYFGRPSGSAMPLAWAHAEYIKLRRSLAEGRVFDMPERSRQRYVVEQTRSPHVIWALNHRRPTMPSGKLLRIQLNSPAWITWRVDGTRQGGRVATRDTGLGVHYADLPTGDLPEGAVMRFSFDSVKGKWVSRKEWFVSKSDEVRVVAEEEAELAAAYEARA